MLSKIFLVFNGCMGKLRNGVKGGSYAKVIGEGTTERIILTYMENSPKLERMPTLCRSATLLAETTISKWRVTATIRQLLQLPTGRTSAFGSLRAIASLRPHSNFRDAPLFGSHQLPLYRNERLEWQIPTQIP